MHNKIKCYIVFLVLTVLMLVPWNVSAKKIVHDAEYYIAEVQNGEKWAAQDEEIDKKLADLRKKFGSPACLEALDRLRNSFCAWVSTDSKKMAVAAQTALSDFRRAR